MRKRTARMTGIFLVMSALTVGCSDLPRDPEGTKRKIEASRRIRVGVSEVAPWVMRRADGSAGGIEGDLVSAIAAESGSKVDWVWGSTEQHMKSLEVFELDLVAAGIDAESPWTRKVATTRPYLRTREPKLDRILAVPPGENAWLLYVDRQLAGKREVVRRRLGELAR